MAKRYADAFWRDAVRIAATSGVTRPQLSSDLGGGQSTLSKWGQQHQHVDLMSGLHDDVEKKNTPSQKSSPSARGAECAKKTQQSSNLRALHSNAPRGFFAGQS